MALMFQRLAQNYAKNGYFPTDSDTTARILNAIKPSESGLMRIIDPCCGEGVILAECKHYLGNDNTVAYGIEYNSERAWHSKKIIDHCVHSDINDVVMGARSFSFMLLNPPYGDMISDKSDPSSKRTRMEIDFYRRTHGLLQYGGIIALILPHYALTKEYATMITRHFSNVKVFAAPEQRFKQIVIFGIKERSAEPNKKMRDHLMTIGTGDLKPDVIPKEWPDEQKYLVPAVINKHIKFYAVRVDKRQLADVISQVPTLWDQMGLMFRYDGTAHRPPLCKPYDWHLAIMLAAGQISGVVKSNDDRIWVIKGDTFKDKSVKEEVEHNSKGEISGSKRICTDRFVPTIRAWDFTHNSETFGMSMIIK